MHSPLEITQILPASPALVFEMFSSKEHLANWWGPEGMGIEVKTFDFQPEGTFHYVLKAGSFEMWGKFTYLEIDAPNRIALLNAFSNPEGETINAPAVPFGADWPLEMWTEYRFIPEGDQCLLRLTSHPHQASDASQKLFTQNHGNMKQGFKSTFDKLESYLKVLRSDEVSKKP
ncbi:hypothetical protein GCM10009119_31920 [Algoriphagus jejuensis]|uniref:Activator of Hsp90 ATPase homologue 1/2-like C-terminal domain-containing protein n=1 Tax=Algoriphagus jejuensis TaxID=419934 RepID=A0ABP3YHX2_9BACT